MNSVELPFSGKVVIVTGAASGIGLAATQLFLSQGASVVAEDINPDIEKQFADMSTAATLVGDVSKEETAVEAVWRTGAVREGRYSRQQRRSYRLQTCSRDVAGGQGLDHGLDLDRGLSSFPRSTQGNDSEPDGAIINIGWYACFQTFPGISAYAAAKGALAQLTRTFALDAIGHGIRVNGVGSGDVITNLLNTFRSDGREFLSEHGRNAPIKRAPRPEEIAEVAFLASEKASFIWVPW